MRAKEIDAWLKTLCDVELNPTVDRVVIGDPNTEIKKLGTCWMPYWNTLKEAHRRGVNVLVVHEPTFYTHWDLDEPKQPYEKTTAAKKRWILQHKMVIIRCHDMLDRLQHDGIPFAFGEGLGFKPGDLIRREKFYNVYAIKPAKPAWQVAQWLADRLSGIGQDGVEFYGDPNRKVKSVGLGTGCGCDPIHFAHMKPDLFVAIDDSIRTWTQTTFSEDTGLPLVVIHHGSSEEFGMQRLNTLIAREYPNLPLVHFKQGCGYRWIAARRKLAKRT